MSSEHAHKRELRHRLVQHMATPAKQQQQKTRFYTGKFIDNRIEQDRGPQKIGSGLTWSIRGKCIRPGNEAASFSFQIFSSLWYRTPSPCLGLVPTIPCMARRKFGDSVKLDVVAPSVPIHVQPLPVMPWERDKKWKLDDGFLSRSPTRLRIDRNRSVTVSYLLDCFLKNFLRIIGSGADQIYCTPAFLHLHD